MSELSNGRTRNDERKGERNKRGRDARDGCDNADGHEEDDGNGDGEEEAPDRELQRVEREEDHGREEVDAKDGGVEGGRDRLVRALEHCGKELRVSTALDDDDDDEGEQDALSTWMSARASFLAQSAALMSPQCHSATVTRALVRTAKLTPYDRAKYGVRRSGPTSAYRSSLSDRSGSRISRTSRRCSKAHVSAWSSGGSNT